MAKAEAHYYPFGLNAEGNWNGKDGSNKIQYNGKEWNDDFRLGWNDYGVRFYDPTTVRFQTIDPLADVYAFQNPYAYAANDPVNNIDFMGMGLDDWKKAGADGVTDEQWLSANRAADGGQNGRMKSASQGNRNDKDEAQRENTKNGRSRNIEDSDIAESYSVTEVRDEAGNSYGYNSGCDCGCPGKAPCPYPKTGYFATDTYNSLKYAVKAVGWMTSETLSGADDVVTGGAGKDALNGDYTKAATMAIISRVLKPVGLGSTGRAVAGNLMEQMALESILENPTMGKVVMTGMTGMTDSRWLGWSKMQYNLKSSNGVQVSIHYVAEFKNGVMTAIDDFKFK